MKTLQPLRPAMKSLIALIAIVSISATLTAEQPTTATNRPCCIQLPAAMPSSKLPDLSDNSLFHLDSTWTNDAARPLKLLSLQGRPLVVTMFFSSCAYACPILVHDMKRI